MLDEVPLEGRGEYREALDRQLNAPLDPVEREAWEQEQWEREAIVASEAAEETFTAWEGAGV